MAKMALTMVNNGDDGVDDGVDDGDDGVENCF